MKTILNKIQARHDEQSAYERGDAGLPDVIWDDMFYIAHADRQALLDIIRDIGNLYGVYTLHGDVREVINRTEP